ncbi:GAF and ANTAR domain-containing protein [Kribbella sp. NPDC005582]|uniref:GAF and ANTAR domain-containing protein n=1 Tax=Kribbella sp. NPDC005582 TaxID=3156893 RepID=UPI0033A223F5
MRSHDQLAAELGHLARALQQICSAGELLQEIVASAVHLIPGAEEGSIADITNRRHIEHKASTSDWVRSTDLLMAETGQGPCLDAIWTQRTLRVDDLATERRWPEFTRQAVNLGARSVLSFQLYVEHGNLGALNVYSRTPGAFNDDSEHVGLLVATHAAIAYAGSRKRQHLEDGLDSRGRIGQAMGILMERHQLDRARAFTVLARYSQDGNRKLHSIADDIVRDTESAALTHPAVSSSGSS